MILLVQIMHILGKNSATLTTGGWGVFQIQQMSEIWDKITGLNVKSVLNPFMKKGG